MLDWGKAQIQGITLRQDKVNIYMVIEEILKFVKIVANNKGVIIKNEIYPDVFVFADQNHLRFIFRNVISNAIKYTPEGGEVRISHEQQAEEGMEVFSVKDNGVGISEEKVNGIFEQYGQTQPGTNNERGNGIGLWLCKEFILQNGGRIWVESEPGAGSVFFFSLKATWPEEVINKVENV